jgi:hypothetical protein
MGHLARIRVVPLGAGSRFSEWRVVRSGAVASWSLSPLHRLAQFRSVGLRVLDPRSAPRRFGSSPFKGTLNSEDAEVLVDVLRASTSTPECCYRCVWDGWVGTPI